MNQRVQSRDLVNIPDIRVGEFATFVNALIHLRPFYVSKLLPHDPRSATYKLKRDLYLTPENCVELYEVVASYFGLDICELHSARLQRGDMTIGEFHSLLCNAAEQAELTRRVRHVPYRLY